MKSAALLVLSLAFSFVHAQSLPIDFEQNISTADFVDFDGGIATVIENPFPSGLNSSVTVARIVRDGGTIWSGSKIRLDGNLDFETMNGISMKVYTSAPVGTVVKFKLEGNGQTERDAVTTVSDEWEVLTWDFTGEPMNFNDLVFMFDFGNVGDGSESSVFYFDDVEQLFGGTQIDWPVDFEGETVNYTMSDFGGNRSELVTDPFDPDNMVIKVVKTDGAATWAGTTIGTPAGFATDIPLSLTESKMTVSVWSPEAGTPIRLKVEDSNDPTHTCETETNTTLAGEWEQIEFDFLNQAPGTELLSIGVERDWRFNMASIFFNFGTEGSEAGETTYYFDNVLFGEPALHTDNSIAPQIKVYPNPASGFWTIESEEKEMTLIEIFNTNGQVLLSYHSVPPTFSIDATLFSEGLYVAKISTTRGYTFVSLIKE